MSTLGLRSLEFGSLLSYTSRPASLDQDRKKNMLKTKDMVIWLKQDQGVQWNGASMEMSEYVAELLDLTLTSFPLSSFFSADTSLIPIPRSSPIRPDGLWVPERIAKAMVRRGIGNSVIACLNRAISVNKSSISTPANRPKAPDHYHSFSVKRIVSEPKDIVLIDDVITRGSTMIGAANRIANAFPEAKIKAFAAVRTITNPNDFTDWYDPQVGVITLNSLDGAFRRP